MNNPKLTKYRVKRKSTWIKLHVYAGLFTCWYLLAFGVSSLILNHKLDVENDGITDTWTTQVSYDPSSSDLDNITRIRDTLDLMGWLPPWEIKKDSASLSFILTHLGKTSDLHLNLASGLLQVNERPKGMLAVLHGLHFFNGKIPNAPFLLRTWMVYQWLALFVLLISLCIGVWMWMRYSYRAWEAYVFGGLFLLSIFLMTMI